MTEKTTVKTLKDVVVRFCGDSGDGMQLTGTIFSDLSAVFGNTISTFPIIRQKFVLHKGHWAEYPDFKYTSEPIWYVLPAIWLTFS